MRWFKHDSNANADSKLQNVLLDYGLEGYGLYWYCIELIAGKVDAENITFQLEHDARIIARNTGCTAQKVEEMMRYFVKQGLFEDNDGIITCMKLAKRLDKSMTSNPEMRMIIESLRRHDSVMIPSEVNHDGVMQDKIRKDEKKPPLPPKGGDDAAAECLEKFNQITKSRCRNASDFEKLLSAGYSVDEISLVIEWVSRTGYCGPTPSIQNVCRATKFDHKLSLAMKWRESESLYGSVIDFYNETLGHVLVRSEKIVTHRLMALIDEMTGILKPKNRTVNDYISYVAELVGAGEVDWMTGGGERGFVANIEYILKPETMKMLIER